MLRGVIVTNGGPKPSAWDVLDYKDKLPVATMNATSYGCSGVSTKAAAELMRQGWTEGAIDDCAAWYLDILPHSHRL